MKDPAPEATEIGRTIVAQARAIRRRMIQDAEDRRRDARDALEAARQALDEAVAALDVEPDDREHEREAPETDAAPPEPAHRDEPPAEAPSVPDRHREPGAKGRRPDVRDSDAVFALLRGGNGPAGVEPVQPQAPRVLAVPEEVAVPEESAVPERPERGSKPHNDDAVRARRDEVVAPILPELRRATQRLLGDEHNVLLDAVRRAGNRLDAERLLPDPKLHHEAWAAVLGPALEVVYAGGRTAVGRAGRGVPARLVKELADGVVAPLRDRLTAAIDATVREGPYATTPELHRVLGSAISARYREWRGDDLERHLADLLAAAYAQGSYDAAPPGARLRWVPADPGQCPDCDDNGLEPTVKGDAFPTGRRRPPAHPGCRCLIVLAD